MFPVQELQDRLRLLAQEGVASMKILLGPIRILNIMNKIGPVFQPTTEFAVSRKNPTLRTMTLDWQQPPTLELIAYRVAAAPYRCRNKTYLCRSPGREVETRWISTVRMTSLTVPANLARTRPAVLLLKTGAPNAIIANDCTAGVWTLGKISEHERLTAALHSTLGPVTTLVALDS